MHQQTKYAVVSGAGKGIGSAITRTLAANGYTVIACARTRTDLESLQLEYSNVIPFDADLSTAHGVESLVQYIKQYCGTPQVVVNNLGVFAVDTILGTTTELLEQQMQVNFWSTYRLTMLFVQSMAERGSGHIINICSIASIEAVPYASSYSISKHAQLGFSRVLQSDLKDKGVFVTSVIPGNVDTPSWDGSGADRSNFIKPQQIADLVLAEINAKRSNEVIIRNK
jgi:short-subunit dehydrogenase